MRTLSQIVYPNQSWWLHGTGRYCRLMESVGPVNLRMIRQGRIVYDAASVEAGFWTMPDGGFDAVEVVTLGDPQLIKIAISDGEGGYDRYTGTVNMATASSIVNTGVKPVAIAATLVVPADGKRKGIRFLNSGATVLYLGGAGIDLVSGCLKLGPGELLFEGDAPSAAWYAVSDGGPGFVKVQELIG
jgi:hypothetical protein